MFSLVLFSDKLYVLISAMTSSNKPEVTKLSKQKAYKRSFSNGGSVEGVCVGLAIFILIFVAMGVYKSWEDIRFLIGAYSTNGIIASCKIEHDRTGPYCQATIRFGTLTGQQITFSSADGSANVGDIVPILYHQNEPGDARLDTRSFDFTLAGVSSGALLLEFCLFKLWKRRKVREYTLKHKGWTPKRGGRAKRSHRFTKSYQKYKRG